MVLLVITGFALAVFFVIDTVQDVQDYKLERAIDDSRDLRWRNILDAIESHDRDLELGAAIDRHPSNWDDEQ